MHRPWFNQTQTTYNKQKNSLHYSLCIHNILTKMFRPVFLPPSGWKKKKKMQDLQLWLAVSQSLHNNW
jgi:hypothetical protein